MTRSAFRDQLETTSSIEEVFLQEEEALVPYLDWAGAFFYPEEKGQIDNGIGLRFYPERGVFSDSIHSGIREEYVKQAGIEALFRGRSLQGGRERYRYRDLKTRYQEILQEGARAAFSQGTTEEETRLQSRLERNFQNASAFVLIPKARVVLRGRDRRPIDQPLEDRSLEEESLEDSPSEKANVGRDDSFRILAFEDQETAGAVISRLRDKMETSSALPRAETSAGVASRIREGKIQNRTFRQPAVWLWPHWAGDVRIPEAEEMLAS